MAHATADISTVNYTTSLVAGHHTLTADEGAVAGGQDAGPSPHEMLCAALGACTAITLRMYAERKEWLLSHEGLLIAAGSIVTASQAAFEPQATLW